MSGSTAEVALKLTAQNLASRQLSQVSSGLSDVDRQAQKASSGGLSRLSGLLIGGVAVGLAAVVGGLAAAAQAAAKEQVGIVKLNTALKENDKAHIGTGAIEDAIAKREKLAFTDDALRDSLSFLVTKTKDAHEALAVQTVAMDIARLKSIDLQTATELVSKGMEGNSKVLKQLGLQDLPATATAQERLAAIQKVGAGQAEAYSKTAVGAQERFGIAVGDLVEDLGEAFLPILTDVANFLSDTVVPAIRDVIKGIQKWLADNKPLVDFIKNVLGGALSILVTVIGNVVKGFAAVIGWFTSNKPLMKGIGDAFRAIASVIGVIVDGLRWIIDNAGKALGALDKMAKNASPTAKHYMGVPGYASGGWAGMNGPELAVLGERGPEYVVPNHELGGMGGQPVTIAVQMDGETVARLVDKRLYYRFTTAATVPRA